MNVNQDGGGKGVRWELGKIQVIEMATVNHPFHLLTIAATARLLLTLFVKMLINRYTSALLEKKKTIKKWQEIQETRILLMHR